ncbi:hypothetical protein [Actinoplanes subglobosus]|uniref:Uncharacterized protein n=1 Tax=Actinoplanes subglobosus TaxID=1547892 RepID=A0ABV8IUU3_9ACTN
MTTVLPKNPLQLFAVTPAVPSDADLLNVLAGLLTARPGPSVGRRLSTLVSFVCATGCPAELAEARALRLEQELAEYLNARHVLRTAQATPDGLDAWAAGAPIVVPRAAVIACARCQTAGGTR